MPHRDLTWLTPAIRRSHEQRAEFRHHDDRAGSPAATAHRTDELIATLAERIGGRFGVSSVFGAPVERDGVTVIPVATVRFGFGGGTGSDPNKRQEGEGAGAGGSMTPAGYIELKDGRSRYAPIVRPERMVAIAFMAALVALIVVRPTAAGRGSGRRLPFIR